jgi:C1A family cysteine protease
MKTFALAAIASVVAASEFDLEKQFAHYIVEHGKNYKNYAEYAMRYENFVKAHAEIAELNSENGSATYGHNMFSDMTDVEFSRYLGEVHIDSDMVSTVVDAMPKASSVDWRSVSPAVVNPVKNQASCGSCWAFSAAGVLESAHAIATGELLSFSEQEIVDCVPNCYGCNGGMSKYAFDYFKDNGIVTEDEYPYTATTGTCQSSALTSGKVHVNSDEWTTPYSSSALKASIEKQPTSVSVQADKSPFRYYTSGVVTGTACGTATNHAIIAVGYGTENGQEYYIVRNSWGASWGDEGYIKIGVEDGIGVCGIQKHPSSAWTN